MLQRQFERAREAGFTAMGGTEIELYLHRARMVDKFVPEDRGIVRGIARNLDIKDSSGQIMLDHLPGEVTLQINGAAQL